jgi:hypothetical protein
MGLYPVRDVAHFFLSDALIPPLPRMRRPNLNTHRRGERAGVRRQQVVAQTFCLCRADRNVCPTRSTTLSSAKLVHIVTTSVHIEPRADHFVAPPKEAENRP